LVNVDFCKIYVFLNSCGGDVDKALKKMERFYEIKHNAPEFFANRDVTSESFKKTMKNSYFISLPVTPDNCNLIGHGVISTDPNDYEYDDAIKAFIMVCEAYTYKNGPRDGTIFINDLKGTSFRHVFCPSLSSLRKGIAFLQEASPMDVKAIHIMNTQPFAYYFINMIKPFLWSDMLQKVYLPSIAEIHENKLRRSTKCTTTSSLRSCR
jgi:CRAL/TRIO domain